MPRVVGLVGRAEDPAERKTPPGRTQRREGRAMIELSLDPVGSLLPFRAEGLDFQAQFLGQRPADEAADRVRLPARQFHGVDKQMHLGRRMSRYVSA